MNYAIIRTGSKQYQAVTGKTIKVEKLEVAEGAVVFDQVLLHVDGDKVEVGTPVLSGIKVFGTAMGTLKADKIQVFKYKSNHAIASSVVTASPILWLKLSLLAKNLLPKNLLPKRPKKLLK